MTPPPPPPELPTFTARLNALFDERSHQRRPAPPRSRVERGLAEHVKIQQAEFKRLQTLTGRDFTWDACCADNGCNAHCEKFSSPSNSFLNAEVSGHHIWMFPPIHIAEECIQRLHCQWEQPCGDTSACVFIPQTFSHMLNQFDGCARLIAKYAVRSPVLSTADGLKTLYTSQPMCAYHIPPRNSLSLNATHAMRDDDDMLDEPTHTPLAFVFDARCQHIGSQPSRNTPFSAAIMADTGATTRFASKEWVTANKLRIKPTHANWTVRVANNEVVPVAGTVDVDIDIQGYRDKVKFLVMPMSKGYDLILGNDWFIKRQAVLSYESKTVEVMRGGKRYKLLPRTSVASTARDLQHPVRESTFGDIDPTNHESFVLNYTQAKRVLKKRHDWHVVELQCIAPDDDDDDDDEEISMTKATPTIPTQATRDADVRKAITELENEVRRSDPNALHSQPDTEPPEPPDADSAQLSANIQKLKDEFGVSVFKEELPGIRQQGEPVEAIPTIPGAKPPTRGLGRYSKYDREELDKQIATLLKQGMIEPSLSPYAAAALIVPKYNPDGSIKGWRMVIDYRLLNAITVKFQFPMPRVDDIMDSLNGAKFFSACDATWGFWQLRLHPSDVPKTAFKTPSGLYQWRVLPFGLSNSPAVFQRTMSSFFQKAYTDPDTGVTVTALGTFIQVYMDDLMIYSKTPEEHLKHLRFVFETLKTNVIYLNPKKCEFNKSEVRFLGHLVSRRGVRPDPAKVSVMKSWPAPTNKQELYRFLGFANYFRQFIRNYATIASPLYPLTQVNAADEFKKKWSSLCQECFEAIKLALCHAPTLKMPDFDNPFEVIVDASNVAIGAVLIQDRRPVAYESKKLSSAEMKWTTTERELYAGVHALKQWQCYLRHPTHTFTLWTDHHPNTFFSTTHRPLSPRQARWQEFLGPFNFVWKYKKGPENIADTLSRPPEAGDAMCVANTMILIEHSPELMVMTRAARLKEAKRQPHTTIDTHSPPNKRTRLDTPPRRPHDNGRSSSTSKHVSFDPALPIPSPAETIPPRRFATPHASLTRFERALWEARDNPFFLQHQESNTWCQDGHGLWRDGKGRLVIPTDDLRTLVVQACHDSVFSGHFGKKKTLSLCERLFYWPGITRQVEKYCKSCLTCQTVKPTNHKPYGMIRPLAVPDGKWTDVSVDMVTDLPVTKRGYDSIIVFVCRLTKMCHLVPTTKKMDTPEFIRVFVDTVVKLHGAPLRLVSDRGSIFTSQFARCAMPLIGTLQNYSTAFHPQSDGQTERMNRVMEDVLRCYASTDEDSWDVQLPMVEFAINNSPAESTHQTPFVLNYGVHPRHPGLAQLVRPQQELSVAIDTPCAFELNQVATRDIPEVPAAVRFTQEMQAAIDHTKMLLHASRQRMMAIANPHRIEAPFRVGDMVFLSTRYIKLKYKGCPKLMPRYVGPFPIVASIGSVSFRLQLPSKMRIHPVFHASLLKPYVHRPGVAMHPRAVVVDDEEEFVVDRLMDVKERTSTKRVKHGKPQVRTYRSYLVRWAGYGPEHDQWLREDELERNCKSLIREFHARRS